MAETLKYEIDRLRAELLDDASGDGRAPRNPYFSYYSRGLREQESLQDLYYTGDSRSITVRGLRVGNTALEDEGVVRERLGLMTNVEPVAPEGLGVPAVKPAKSQGPKRSLLKKLWDTKTAVEVGAGAGLARFASSTLGVVDYLESALNPWQTREDAIERSAGRERLIEAGKKKLLLLGGVSPEQNIEFNRRLTDEGLRSALAYSAANPDVLAGTIAEVGTDVAANIALIFATGGTAGAVKGGVTAGVRGSMATSRAAIIGSKVTSYVAGTRLASGAVATTRSVGALTPKFIKAAAARGGSRGALLFAAQAAEKTAASTYNSVIDIPLETLVTSDGYQTYAEAVKARGEVPSVEVYRKELAGSMAQKAGAVGGLATVATISVIPSGNLVEQVVPNLLRRVMVGRGGARVARSAAQNSVLTPKSVALAVTGGFTAEAVQEGAEEYLQATATDAALRAAMRGGSFSDEFASVITSPSKETIGSAKLGAFLGGLFGAGGGVLQVTVDNGVVSFDPDTKKKIDTKASAVSDTVNRHVGETSVINGRIMSELREKIKTDILTDDDIQTYKSMLNREISKRASALGQELEGLGIDPGLVAAGQRFYIDTVTDTKVSNRKLAKGTPVAISREAAALQDILSGIRGEVTTRAAEVTGFDPDSYVGVVPTNFTVTDMTLDDYKELSKDPLYIEGLNVLHATQRGTFSAARKAAGLGDSVGDLQSPTVLDMAEVVRATGLAPTFAPVAVGKRGETVTSVLMRNDYGGVVYLTKDKSGKFVPVKPSKEQAEELRLGGNFFSKLTPELTVPANQAGLEYEDNDAFKDLQRDSFLITNIEDVASASQSLAESGYDGTATPIGVIGKSYLVEDSIEDQIGLLDKDTLEFTPLDKADPVTRAVADDMISELSKGLDEAVVDTVRENVVDTAPLFTNTVPGRVIGDATLGIDSEITTDFPSDGYNLLRTAPPAAMIKTPKGGKKQAGLGKKLSAKQKENLALSLINNTAGLSNAQLDVVKFVKDLPPDYSQSVEAYKLDPNEFLFIEETPEGRKVGLVLSRLPDEKNDIVLGVVAKTLQIHTIKDLIADKSVLYQIADYLRLQSLKSALTEDGRDAWSEAALKALGRKKSGQDVVNFSDEVKMLATMEEFLISDLDDTFKGREMLLRALVKTGALPPEATSIASDKRATILVDNNLILTKAERELVRTAMKRGSGQALKETDRIKLSHIVSSKLFNERVLRPSSGRRVGLLDTMNGMFNTTTTWAKEAITNFVLPATTGRYLSFSIPFKNMSTFFKDNGVNVEFDEAAFDALSSARVKLDNWVAEVLVPLEEGVSDAYSKFLERTRKKNIPHEYGGADGKSKWIRDVEFILRMNHAIIRNKVLYYTRTPLNSRELNQAYWEEKAAAYEIDINSPEVQRVITKRDEAGDLQYLTPQLVVGRIMEQVQLGKIEPQTAKQMLTLLVDDEANWDLLTIGKKANISGVSKFELLDPQQQKEIMDKMRTFLKSRSGYTDEEAFGYITANQHLIISADDLRGPYNAVTNRVRQEEELALLGSRGHNVINLYDTWRWSETYMPMISQRRLGTEIEKFSASGNINPNAGLVPTMVAEGSMADKELFGQDSFVSIPVWAAARLSMSARQQELSRFLDTMYRVAENHPELAQKAGLLAGEAYNQTRYDSEKAQFVTPEAPGALNKEGYIRYNVGGRIKTIRVNKDVYRSVANMFKSSRDLSRFAQSRIGRGLQRATRIYARMVASYDIPVLLKGLTRDSTGMLERVFSTAGNPALGLKRAGIAAKVMVDPRIWDLLVKTSGLSAEARQNALKETIKQKGAVGQAAEFLSDHPVFSAGRAMNELGFGADTTTAKALNDLKVSLEKGQMTKKEKTKAIKATMKALDGISGFASFLDQLYRVGAYVALRDTGMDKRSSFRFARDLMNWDNVSDYGRTLNVMYAFSQTAATGAFQDLTKWLWKDQQPPMKTYQAADGSQRVGLDLAKVPSQLNKTRAAVMMTNGFISYNVKILLLSAVLGSAGLAADEIEELFATLENSFFTSGIPVPINAKGDALLVHQQFGISAVLSSIGTMAARLQLGHTNSEDALNTITNQVAVQFAPGGASRVATDPTGLGFLASLVPTVIQPMSDLALNRSFFGGPINPSAGRGFRSDNALSAVPKEYIKAAQYLREVTGGDTGTGLDIGAGTIRHLVRSYGWMIGKSVDGMLKAADNRRSKTSRLLDASPLPTWSGAEYLPTSALWAEAEHIKTYSKRLASIKRLEGKAAASAYAAENVEYELARKVFERYRKDVRDIEKMRRMLDDKIAKASSKEEKTKLLDDMEKLNRTRDALALATAQTIRDARQAAPQR